MSSSLDLNTATCSFFEARTKGPKTRVIYLCDWLPPDYGAVGQYSVMFARQLAEEGREVILVGLTSRRNSEVSEPVGGGQLRQIRIKAPVYDKASLSHRLIWTATTNTRLLWHVRHHLRRADIVVLTGSPPLLLHWLAPLNLFLRKSLVYRITDFHPECLMAQRGRGNIAMRILYRLTLFWRRRIDEFEALGNDQIERLLQIGIPRDRIRLKRDPSPVRIDARTRPLSRPEGAGDRLLLLYSGNWGVAHDHKTFVAGYRLHHQKGSGRICLWLNAVGAAVEKVAQELARHQLPFIRGTPVPIEALASLLVTPDAHLITLSNEFVGFVLPSKVHGCIESGRPVLFVGSESSDVHLLCSEQMTAPYRRVDVSDIEGCWRALEDLAHMQATVPNSVGMDSER